MGGVMKRKSNGRGTWVIGAGHRHCGAPSSPSHREPLVAHLGHLIGMLQAHLWPLSLNPQTSREAILGS
jgi:hypothetical protein